MAVAAPFGLLFLLRRRYFVQQSRALYRRYAHVLTIFFMLFGLVLVEQPTLLAAPILHFWRDPGNWQAGLAYAGGWVALIALWARVHRPFVRGAALAHFVRTSIHGQRIAPALDVALLLVALQWWALPFAIAIWTAATSTAPPPGADGYFPFYLVVLVLLTVAVAHVMVFGARPAHDRRPPGAGGVLRGPALMFLTGLQVRALWRAHLHVALPRIGLALLLHAGCWWMINKVGKHQDAAGFIAVACCVTAYALSGLYYAFWHARQPIEPYLRSMPFGVARTLVAEHLVVLGIGSIVCALVGLAYRFVPADGPDLLPMLASCAGMALLLLPLLGAPVLQRHPQGVACKVALTVVTLLLMGAMG